MKIIIILFIGLINCSAFATPLTEVELNSKSVSLPDGLKSGEQITLIRNSNTPELLTINLNHVPATQLVCEKSETQSVFGESSVCGTGVRVEKDCWNDWSDVTHSFVTRCQDKLVNYTLSCYHPETVCVEYGTSSIELSNSFEIEFKVKKSLLKETIQLTATVDVQNNGGINPRLNLNLSSNDTNHEVSIDQKWGGFKIKVK